MTDNGSCYKSFAFRRQCKRLGLKHFRTKPYTPKTNGNAERFIQTCLREWAYAQAYHHSRQRTQQLPYWLHRYNLAQTSYRRWCRNTHQQTRSIREQPVEAPHLACEQAPALS
jgi:transposase InsO family protein